MVNRRPYMLHMRLGRFRDDCRFLVMLTDLSGLRKLTSLSIICLIARSVEIVY